MQPMVTGVPSTATARDVAGLVDPDALGLPPVHPVVSADGALVGVVTRRRLQSFTNESEPAGRSVLDVTVASPVTAMADEPLCDVVRRMAETGRTSLPVVDRDAPTQLLGMITLTHTLEAKRRHVEEERRRERVLKVGGLLPLGWRRSAPGSVDVSQPGAPTA